VGGGAGDAGGAPRDTRRRVAKAQPLPRRGEREAGGRPSPGADARLLVISYDAKTGDDLVEVAHEALIREWRGCEGGSTRGGMPSR